MVGLNHNYHLRKRTKYDKNNNNNNGFYDKNPLLQQDDDVNDDDIINDDLGYVKKKNNDNDNDDDNYNYDDTTGEKSYNNTYIADDEGVEECKKGERKREREREDEKAGEGEGEESGNKLQGKQFEVFTSCPNKSDSSSDVYSFDKEKDKEEKQKKRQNEKEKEKEKEKEMEKEKKKHMMNETILKQNREYMEKEFLTSLQNINRNEIEKKEIVRLLMEEVEGKGKIYIFISTQFDKQDNSLVDKILINSYHVKSFCNTLYPESEKLINIKNKGIKFDFLDNNINNIGSKSNITKVYGLWGELPLIGLHLYENGIITEKVYELFSISNKRQKNVEGMDGMIEERIVLSSGIMGIHHKNILYLILLPPPAAFFDDDSVLTSTSTSAPIQKTFIENHVNESCKSIMSQLLRYLFDLTPNIISFIRKEHFMKYDFEKMILNQNNEDDDDYSDTDDFIISDYIEQEKEINLQSDFNILENFYNRFHYNYYSSDKDQQEEYRPILYGAFNSDVICRRRPFQNRTEWNSGKSRTCRSRDDFYNWDLFKSHAISLELPYHYCNDLDQIVKILAPDRYEAIEKEKKNAVSHIKKTYANDKKKINSTYNEQGLLSREIIQKLIERWQLENLVSDDTKEFLSEHSNQEMIRRIQKEKFKNVYNTSSYEAKTLEEYLNEFWDYRKFIFACKELIPEKGVVTRALFDNFKNSGMKGHVKTDIVEEIKKNRGKKSKDEKTILEKGLEKGKKVFQSISSIMLSDDQKESDNSESDQTIKDFNLNMVEEVILRQNKSKSEYFHALLSDESKLKNVTEWIDRLKNQCMIAVRESLGNSQKTDEGNIERRKTEDIENVENLKDAEVQSLLENCFHQNQEIPTHFEDQKKYGLKITNISFQRGWRDGWMSESIKITYDQEIPQNVVEHDLFCFQKIKNSGITNNKMSVQKLGRENFLPKDQQVVFCYLAQNNNMITLVDRKESDEGYMFDIYIDTNQSTANKFRKKAKALGKVMNAFDFSQDKNRFAFFSKDQAVIQMFQLNDRATELQKIPGSDIRLDQMNLGFSFTDVWKIKFIPNKSELAVFGKCGLMKRINLNQSAPVKSYPFKIDNGCKQVLLTMECLFVVTEDEKAVCGICSENFSGVESDGVICQSGHFTCNTCLGRYTDMEYEKLEKMEDIVGKAEGISDKKCIAYQKLIGKLICPQHVANNACDAIFGKTQLRNHLSDVHYEKAFFKAPNILPTKAKRLQENEKMQKVFELIEQGKQAEVKNDVLKSSLLALFPDSLMCPKCSYGPVTRLACSNLSSHHGQGGIDNRCPNCQFFAEDTSQWERWNGILPDNFLEKSTKLDEFKFNLDINEAVVEVVEEEEEENLQGMEIEGRNDVEIRPDCKISQISMHVYFFNEQGKNQKKFKTEDLSDDINPEDLESLHFVENKSDDGGIELQLQWFCKETLEIRTKRITIVGEERQLSCEKANTKDESKVTQESNYVPPPFFYLQNMFHTFPLISTFDNECPINSQKIYEIILYIKDAEGNSISAKTKEACCQFFVSQFNRNENLAQSKKQKLKSYLKLSVEESLSVINAQNNSLDLSQNVQDDKINVKDVIWTLITKVPLQIARSEHNNFIALSNGLHMPGEDVEQMDLSDIFDSIELGLYESIFASWHKEICIISSMGMQSTGKSFWLNHLCGSRFNTSGARCTDGVWLSCRIIKDNKGIEKLLVILDFEGLGSFERSAQEDMLLSIFNAAISHMTVYRTENFFGRDAASTFDKFESGVGRVKSDKLFNGTFYISIKDVMERSGTTKREFEEKIKEKVLRNSNGTVNSKNFISTMFSGRVSVAPYPPPSQDSYFKQLETAKKRFLDISNSKSFSNGDEFVQIMKHLMAKLVLRDWSSFDVQKVTIELKFLYKHILNVIHFGCLTRNSEDAEDHLLDPISGNVIEDLPIVFESYNFDYKDSDLDLSYEVINDEMPQWFMSDIPRESLSPDDYFLLAQKLAHAIVNRRKERVVSWINLRVKSFSVEGEVQRFKQEVLNKLNLLEIKWTFCGGKCQKCFHKCLKEKGKCDGNHSCMAINNDHSCGRFCDYCTMIEKPCCDVSGHDGKHYCDTISHLCGQACCMSNRPNCNQSCILEPGHTGDHLCNSKKHLCGDKCDLKDCLNLCIMEYGIEHERHQCHEVMCPSKCAFESCSHTCAVKDHFHCDSSKIHLCSNEHQCEIDCSSDGICEIHSQGKKEKKVFKGKYDEFEYDRFTEQNGHRKKCCKMIPVGELLHEGEHIHSLQENIEHTCDTKCPSCGYYCNLPWGHTGKHDTKHGNMRHGQLIATEETFEVNGHKYGRGESSRAEMCDMFCKSQGRGHVHAIPCECDNSISDQSTKNRRHVDNEKGNIYGENVGALDEITHDYFWDKLGWEDPCTMEDQDTFRKCPARCSHPDHKITQTEEEGHSLRNNEDEYCTLDCMHEPVVFSESNVGYISTDGHHFKCDHKSGNSIYHTIFVVDCSGSMKTQDVLPDLQIFRDRFPNRLGSVYEASHQFTMSRAPNAPHDKVSLIHFDHQHHEAFQSLPIKGNMISEYVQDNASSYWGGTDFSCGLNKACNIIQNNLANNNSNDGEKQLVMFLSDGGDAGGQSKLNQSLDSLSQISNMELITIGFGHNANVSLLQNMANSVPNGQFIQCVDDIQLCNTFNTIAANMNVRVSVLSRPENESN